MRTDTLHVVDPRAAGIDVHNMQITASVRICAPGGGQPKIETRTFEALARGIDEMVAWMLEHKVNAAVMEGTGICWVAPFEALEAAGISVALVNARQVKQLKGRKTDVADSVWLARVCQFGLANPSHVPPKAFREMRALTRYRRTLVGQRSRVSTKCGSLESLNVSPRCDCKPKAPQMRQIVVCERPLSLAIKRSDQWVASAGIAVSVRSTTSAT